MTLFHVQVEQDGKWFIGRVLERPGITTQGRTLDELVYMLRDAIELMWGEKKVQLELILPHETVTRPQRARVGTTKRRTSPAA